VKNKNASIMVDLIHTGDPKEAWDPEDREVIAGKKPKGDPMNRVLRFFYNGFPVVLRPGKKRRLTKAEALFALRKTTTHRLEKKKNHVSGKTYMEYAENPNPLKMIEHKTETPDKANFGIEYDVDKAPETVDVTPPPKQPEIVMVEEKSLDRMNLPELRAKADELGIEYDGRHKVEGLRAKIEMKLEEGS
jgi:hypothetical protein